MTKCVLMVKVREWFAVIMGALQTSHMSLHVCYVKFAIFVIYKEAVLMIIIPGILNWR